MARSSVPLAIAARSRHRAARRPLTIVSARFFLIDHSFFRVTLLPPLFSRFLSQPLSRKMGNRVGIITIIIITTSATTTSSSNRTESDLNALIYVFDHSIHSPLAIIVSGN